MNRTIAARQGANFNTADIDEKQALVSYQGEDVAHHRILLAA